MSRGKNRTSSVFDRQKWVKLAKVRDLKVKSPGDTDFVIKKIRPLKNGYYKIKSLSLQESSK